MQLRYADIDARDHRLDLLRGFALFAMAVNHLGFHNSLFHTVTGRSVFLINAAEGFFFISGMTLGFIAARDTLGRSVERLLQRTWIVYLATVGIAAGFAALAVSTGLAVWGDPAWIAEGGAGQFLAGVVTLREGFHGSDVLVTYVVYLGVSALALWLLHRGRGIAVGAALGITYLVSQLYPELTEIPVASFRNLAANSPVFFGGLLIGFYRRDLAAWWQRVAAAPLRFTINAMTVVAAALLLCLYATNYTAWPWLGIRLDDTIGLRESAMPPLQLGIVFLYLRAVWILADRLWVAVTAVAGWLLLPLGRASLFTYTAHLVAMVVIFNLPGITDEVGTTAATAIVGLYVAVIYVVVLLRSGARTWLADRPDTVRRLAQRIPATSAAVLVVAAFASGPLWTPTLPDEDLLVWRAEAQALAEYLEDAGVEYELIDEPDLVEIEIDWDDDRSVEIFEEFWIALEEGEIEVDPFEDEGF